MTVTGLKKGSLRPTLSLEMQRLVAGDYHAVVSGRRHALLVRLTAAPIQIAFGQVAYDHVTKEGLADLGDIACVRAVLRRILSLEGKKGWVGDEEKVWWLEWSVVAEI